MNPLNENVYKITEEVLVFENKTCINFNLTNYHFSSKHNIKYVANSMTLFNFRGMFALFSFFFEIKKYCGLLYYALNTAMVGFFYILVSFGIRIPQTPTALILYFAMQSWMVNNIRKRYNIENCNSIALPFKD